MIDGITGASPKPVGNPSPRGAEGGHRLFAAEKLFDQYSSFFVGQMLQSMRETTFQSGLVDGGRAEEAFQGLLDTQYAEALSHKLSFSKTFGKTLARLESASKEAEARLKDADRNGR